MVNAHIDTSCIYFNRADAKAATNADIYLHADGLKLYSAVPDWASEVGMEAAEPPPLPDKSLQVIQLNLEICVLVVSSPLIFTKMSFFVVD